MFNRFKGLATALTLFTALFVTGCETTSGVDLPPQANGAPAPTVNGGITTNGDIAAAVSAFRAALGGVDNGEGAGAASGRREVNWDNVPTALTNVAGYPTDFFQVNSTRGMVITTPGLSLRVSNNTFSDVDASYATQFTTFSAPKAIAPGGSNLLDVQFFVPGTQVPAGVRGFGCVVSDVNTNTTTSLEFFDITDKLIMAKVFAPAKGAKGGLSFVSGIMPAGVLCSHVRITLGTSSLSTGNLDAGTTDLVILDDVIYGEPQAVPFRVTQGSGVFTTSAVNRFRSALGNPLNGNLTTQAAGRRDVNWDGVPPAATDTNTFPVDFFNVNATRGIVLGTPGTGLRVSVQNFSDIDQSYNAQFHNFSSPRTFQAVGSAVVTANFFLPGTATAANVSGFGSVFSDVDQAGTTFIDYFDGAGNSLGSFQAPVRADTNGLSFIGVQFPPTTPVRRVRITSGQGALGAGVKDLSDGGALDLVIMDDFLYGEPK